MSHTVYRDEVHQGYVDLNKNELRNARIQNLGSAPSSPVTGQIYYHSGDNKIYWWNGTSWIDATGAAGAIAATLLDAKGDLIVASANDTPAKLSVGTNGQILVAASGETTGLLWRDADVSDIKGVTTDSLLGRDTTGTGAGELITLGGGLEFTGGAVIRTSAFTGDVTKTAGGTALTIAADAVLRTMMANMAQSTLMGRAAGAGTGDPTDLTPSEVKTLLAYVASDIPFTAADTITSTDVQSAIIEALTDARSYADSLANGFDVKASVRAATTATVTLSGGAPTVIDGVTLVAGNRILVKDQSSDLQNGIYTVTTLGTGANGTWTRATDADASVEVTSGLFTWVEEGTVNADTGWVLTTNNPITVGSTGLTFTQFSGLGQVTAGSGLTKTGNTLDVGAGTGISVASDTVSIDTSVVVRKYVGAITGGATSEVITHNLNSRDVIVALINNATPWDSVDVEWEATSVNTVTLRSPINLPASYRVIVTG